METQFILFEGTRIRISDILRYELGNGYKINIATKQSGILYFDFPNDSMRKSAIKALDKKLEVEPVLY